MNNSHKKFYSFIFLASANFKNTKDKEKDDTREESF